MPSEGGRYRIKNGKRELVHRTKPTPVKTAKADEQQADGVSAKPETAASKPAKSAAKQEVKGNE
ncbi:hypothetical protein [Vreelandella venusta]|uniref:Uncharacterized protein n=1 Tax=Vreelandella venusta TaxID=44935 RepID=A0ABX2BB18_9GAMM|nr:hypothetical protein [Halomonas venusta]AZM96068.1 hypothetical protein EI420_10400 [Halomonas venusta]NPT30643.1 hypothetical protein [Halomonas venusta]